jgi:glyoxylase-like metal-dependent hydrolase (beta-lactamase superfamily II)
MRVETIDLEFQGVAGGIAAYLVWGDEGAILIETGPESARERLEAALARSGLAPSDLKAVFVTHVHLDHAGAAGSFAAAGVPVHVHTRGARHLIDPKRLVESARGVYGDRFDALWGGMVPAPESAVRPLADGEVVRVAGLEVTALDTPGHAFHHHAYAIGDAIFTGDAAGARLGGGRYLSVTSAPPQFHLEHTLASIAKLAALDPARLFLTHFGEVTDPATHLAAYADAVELNAEFIRQRLVEGYSGEALSIAYEAFQLEQAFRLGLPAAAWPHYQAINGTEMCAEGIRMFWEARFAESGAASDRA